MTTSILPEVRILAESNFQDPTRWSTMEYSVPAGSRRPGLPASAADQAPPGAAFDRAVVAARFDNNPSLLREVVELFSSQAQRLITEIRAASGRLDVRGLERAAHKLKGSAGNFGAKGVCATARQLETIARSGDLTAAGDVCSRLAKEVAGLQQSLAEYLEECAPCES